jgi:ferritin
MLQPDIEAALNRQFGLEQAAAQDYLAMAAWFEQNNLPGFAGYMRHQSEEETAHAMRIFDHLNDRGGTVVVGAVPAPRTSFTSPRSVFEAALAREQANTRAIHDLYRLAVEAGDYAAQTMLHWFITEQVEEEKWAVEAVAAFDRAGDDGGTLLLLDERYGRRAETP